VVRTLSVLCVAALMEILGDAWTRVGLSGRLVYSVLGALMLVAYGIVVNQSRLDFNRLMGVYIAVFFVVSQAVAFVMFRSIPDGKLMVGGALIVAGGIYTLV